MSQDKDFYRIMAVSYSQEIVEKFAQDGIPFEEIVRKIAKTYNEGSINRDVATYVIKQFTAFAYLDRFLDHQDQFDAIASGNENAIWDIASRCGINLDVVDNLVVEIEHSTGISVMKEDVQQIVSYIIEKLSNQ